MYGWVLTIPSSRSHSAVSIHQNSFHQVDFRPAEHHATIQHEIVAILDGGGEYIQRTIETVVELAQFGTIHLS